MLKLSLLCLGAALLMVLSQQYHPAQPVRWEGNGHFLGRRADEYMLAVIIWMTCFCFLRTAYNDTGNYIREFMNAQPVSVGIKTGAYSHFMKNPLSSLYRDYMHGITDNYHVYFLFPALLQSIAIVKLYKHYSVSPAMSLLIYFCLGTYALHMSAFKQAMAMTVLLLAFPYACRKKYVTYVLLVLLATLFHFYAIIYLVVPLLFGKPWGKTTILMIAVFMVMLLTYDWTLGALMEYVNQVGGSMAEEEIFDGHAVNVLRVTVYWIPALLALFFWKHVNYQSTRAENALVNMSILCAGILTIGLAEGANLYGRMAGYFEWTMVLTIPMLVKKIFDKDSADFVSVLAAILFFGYFCYEFGVSKNFDATYSAITLWQFFRELVGM